MDPSERDPHERVEPVTPLPTHTVSLDEAEGRGLRGLVGDLAQGRDAVLLEGGRPVAAVVSYEELERFREWRVAVRRRPLDPRLSERLAAVVAMRSYEESGPTVALHEAARRLGFEPKDVVPPAGGLAQFQ